MKNGGIVGPINNSSDTSASGVWSLEEQYSAIKNDRWPNGRQTSVLSGLTYWYVANGFDTASQTWNSYQGYGQSYTTSRGTISKINSSGNGASRAFAILQGSTLDGITLMSLPSTYTLFHVARYNGTEERIFDGKTANWLSGFWNGNAGVAYHDGWITPQTDYHGTNWVISTDQNSLYRSNGIQRGTGGGGTSKQLTINDGNYTSERSDWQVAEILIYNRTLSSSEYQQVESELSEWYGIAI